MGKQILPKLTKQGKKDNNQGMGFFDAIYEIKPPKPPKGKTKVESPASHISHLNHPQVRPVKEDTN